MMHIENVIVEEATQEGGKFIPTGAKVEMVNPEKVMSLFLLTEVLIEQLQEKLSKATSERDRNKYGIAIENIKTDRESFLPEGVNTFIYKGSVFQLIGERLMRGSLQYLN